MKFPVGALLLLLSTTHSAAFAPPRGNFGVARITTAGSLSRQSKVEHVLFSTTEEKRSASSADISAASTDVAAQVVEAAISNQENISPPARTPAEVRSAALSYLMKYKGESGASAVYSKLEENGVKVVNGYSGGAVLPLLDQFHEGHPRHASGKERIRWITNSNEQNAGHVTEGVAKAMPIDDDNLPVGVCIATSGPGVTNLITPLQDAICDGVPMVVLCGQAATTAPADAFQSAPAVELTSPCTKWSYQIKSAAEIPFVLDYAFFVARNGRPGPVFVDLPKDLQNQIIGEDSIKQFVEKSLSLDSDDNFARLVERKRTDGTILPALHFGLTEKGLSFEIIKTLSGVQKLRHIPTIGGADMFDADHTPQNKIYHFEEGVNGAAGASKVGDMDGELMNNIVGLIKMAKKPILLAGQGCNNCPEDLKKLAETLRIPVTTTLHALGCFDERSDLALNMMGMHGHPTPNFMVQEADLIICVGSRFDDRITGRMSDFIPEARKAAEQGRGGVIHVDIRLSEKAKQVVPTFFVHSTGKTFLRKVNEKLAEGGVSGTNTRDWLRRMAELKQKYPIGIPRFPKQTISTVNGDGAEASLTRTPMSAQGVIQNMNLQILKAGMMDDCIFTTGVGIHQMVAAQLITWTQPRQMLSSGSLGTMGVSTGYAVGAKLAQARKIVISVDGDGSFNMTFTELKTIMEQGIPVKILILDNEAQMMVEYWQRLFHEKRYLAVRNTNPDYVVLAQAFGIKSIYCDCDEELPEKMREFLFDDMDKPVLFHVRIERTPCLPLVAPGQRLENMILEDEDFEVDPAAAPS
jgi:acetolactate synthase-1/2/3 large subunit